jgi:hypothetical protein
MQDAFLVLILVICSSEKTLALYSEIKESSPKCSPSYNVPIWMATPPVYFEATVTLTLPFKIIYSSFPKGSSHGFYQFPLVE